MKNTKQLLYQIRGLARSVLAFVFFYQGLAPKILFSVSPEYSNLANDSFLLNHPWLTYLGGFIEIALATWLITSFADKRPLFASIGVLVFSLLTTLLFSSHDFATTFNIVTLTAAVFALIFIDLNILKFQKELLGQKKFGQYLRVTRNRMLYEFVKRLETKDLPHLMHTLAQSRVKRHLKNRRLSKHRIEPSNITTSSQVNDAGNSDFRNERSLIDGKKLSLDIKDDAERSE